MDKEVQENLEDQRSDARQPRVIFLILSGLFAAAAALTYFFEAWIIEQSYQQSATPFAVLLVMLVLLAILALLCYRLPALGNKLLGYSILLERDEKRRANPGFHYTGVFEGDTAKDTKHMNSKRKRARYSRKKMAAVTRDMQADGGEQASDAPAPDRPDAS